MSIFRRNSLSPPDNGARTAIIEASETKLRLSGMILDGVLALRAADRRSTTGTPATMQSQPPRERNLATVDSDDPSDQIARFSETGSNVQGY
jgi:hypothetical protein